MIKFNLQKVRKVRLNAEKNIIKIRRIYYEGKCFEERECKH